MANRPETDIEAEKQLWDQLSDTRTGMLWVQGSGQHPQPMTHFADPDSGALWFITASDTDLVAAMGEGAQAGFTLVSGSGDYHASMTGPLVPYNSDEKIDELWNFAVAAWFEKGRADETVQLIKFTPREASVWASQGNPVLVGLKMMRAAMTEGESHPDVGTHKVLHLSIAA
ncbi:pyridoxamine 5'-phosphate oxidase family protein [Tropicibacter naphthalenivorans]|uniref:Putative stress protein (General stress protein 26) n=1 Tax=Tropicibacter naphthalenivorans TaxID=441103 RepID=A0A0P1G1R6_9RHOB|nr:pyridoxamine 5'-phosphate oxidase family protein [Tropicibacter naphthalenivorans]CUH75646.1 putative stress protein (general stress protein 26) [Tropicibacter naphthalenivorans]SMC43031.1 General stress protein 26 [Tropicibacter naphthalenivorans]